MTTHEPHTDVFYTPRGLTAYATAEDQLIARTARFSESARDANAPLRFGRVLLSMLDAERADRFSYGPSLTTMVDYVMADVHKQTVSQALAVRL